MQKNNRFALRINRFSNPVFIQRTYSCVQIKKNFKSLNLDNEKFTNFASSMGSQKYKLVKGIYIDFLKNVDIIKQFELDEIIYEKAKIERLKNIISTNIEKEVTDSEIVNNVLKFKNRTDKEVQFYFYYDGKILNLLLIDLYHLGIIALKNGIDISERQYLKHKDDKCCLSNVVK